MMKRLTRELALKLAKKHRYSGDFVEFYMGLKVEHEHANVAKSWDVVAKIVLAHLKENKKYYADAYKLGFFDKKEVGLK